MLTLVLILVSVENCLQSDALVRLRTASNQADINRLHYRLIVVVSLLVDNMFSRYCIDTFLY